MDECDSNVLSVVTYYVLFKNLYSGVETRPVPFNSRCAMYAQSF